MPDQWYFSHGLDEFGPFLAGRMKDLAAAGRLLPTDFVWKDGTTARVLAAKVKGLFQQLQPTSPLADEILIAAVSASPPRPDGSASPLLPNSAASASGASPLSASSSRPESATSSKRGDANLSNRVASDHNQRRAQPEPMQKLRVQAIHGAIIVSQDGTVACYRKQCINCHFEETNRTTMRIRRGITRVSFFCPQCKKMRGVEIQGIR